MKKSIKFDAIDKFRTILDNGAERLKFLMLYRKYVMIMIVSQL